MKSTLISLLLLGIMLIIACSSPTKPPTENIIPEPVNYFSFDAQKYNLNNLYMTGYVYNADTLGKKFDLYLFADPVKRPDSLFTHNVNTIYFEMYSPIETYLDTGTYVLSSLVTKKPYNVGGGFCCVNYSFSVSRRTDDPHDFSTATIHVQRYNNVYTVDFEGYLVNYKKVTGHYKGTFSSF